MKKSIILFIGISLCLGCSQPEQHNEQKADSIVTSNGNATIAQPGLQPGGASSSTAEPSTSASAMMRTGKNESTNQGQVMPANTSAPQDHANYDIKTFKNDPPLNGFGYDIYMDGHLYVHQPGIPAVPGNRGFSNAMFAVVTAQFVVKKIQQHVMPPTVEVKELDSLGVLK